MARLTMGPPKGGRLRKLTSRIAGGRTPAPVETNGRSKKPSVKPPRIVWVTRTAPGAEATAARLRALGYEAIAEPLLTVRFVAGAMVNLDKIGAIAFTSVNGVTGFIRRSLERGRTVYAVGAATAAAARAAGFSRVLSTEGDVATLAAGIAARRWELSGAVLHAAATEPSGDLVGALDAHGIKARHLPVYETIPAPPPEELVEMIPSLTAVTVHSAKAARLLAAILADHPARKLRACCLSRAVARPLMRAPVGQLSAAARPTEDALIDLFRK
jgi:uroporphyrinogen-III synthase